MALYGFVSHFHHRSVRREFTWWTSLKWLTGTVTGTVSAALAYVGVVAINPQSKGTGLAILSLVAFAGGFHETWFLEWLNRLKPAHPSSPTPQVTPTRGSPKGIK